MHVSEAGLELLKRAEGFRDQTYTDIAGLQTIGYGHRPLPGESFPNGITLDQAEAILAADLRSAEEAVDRLVHVPVTQGQFDALVDFVFNLGSGRLASSTLLKYLNAGNNEAAAWQLLAWDHAGMHEIPALRRRRVAEFRLWSGAAAPRQSAV
jgi:lysozyme